MGRASFFFSVRRRLSSSADLRNLPRPLRPPVKTSASQDIARAIDDWSPEWTMLCFLEVSEEIQRGKSVTGRSLAAIVLVVLSLLVFTTIHTSPLDAGVGSTLSQTSPKQRQSTIPDFAWCRPVLDLMVLVPLACGDLVCAESEDPFSSPSFGRYFNLPPPAA